MEMILVSKDDLEFVLNALDRNHRVNFRKHLSRSYRDIHQPVIKRLRQATEIAERLRQAEIATDTRCAYRRILWTLCHLLKPIQNQDTDKLQEYATQLKLSGSEGWTTGEMLERAIHTPVPSYDKIETFRRI